VTNDVDVTCRHKKSDGKRNARIIKCILLGVLSVVTSIDDSTATIISATAITHLSIRPVFTF